MKQLILLVATAFLLSGCTIPFLGSKRAGLKIMTTPPASVVLDGKQVGQTPYEDSKLSAKATKLQLVPQSGQPWETTVTLRKNLQQVVERVFGQTDQESEGYVMELSEIGNKAQSQLSVVTIPDPATVRLDGQPKGFSPQSVDLPNDQTHDVSVSSAGYNEKKVSVIVPKGHKLQLTVQLSRTKMGDAAEATPSASPDEETPTPTGKKAKASPTPTVKKSLTPSPSFKTSPTPKLTPKATLTPPERPYVEILETGTTATSDAPRDNWLRVRSDGNQSADVVAYVYAGETYSFIESNENGWYKMTLPDGKEGWISGQYAKLFR